MNEVNVHIPRRTFAGLVLLTKRPALLIATVIAFISLIVAFIYLATVSSGRREAVIKSTRAGWGGASRGWWGR